MEMRLTYEFLGKFFLSEIDSYLSKYIHISLYIKLKIFCSYFVFFLADIGGNLPNKI